MKESDILYENGSFWVFHDTKKKMYTVFRSGLTHSESDSYYDATPDGLSIAKARADYLHKRNTK